MLSLLGQSRSGSATELANPEIKIEDAYTEMVSVKPPERRDYDTRCHLISIFFQNSLISD